MSLMDDIDKILENGNASIACRKAVVDLLSSRVKRIRTSFLITMEDWERMQEKTREYSVGQKTEVLTRKLGAEILAQFPLEKETDYKMHSVVYRFEVDFYKSMV